MTTRFPQGYFVDDRPRMLEHPVPVDAVDNKTIPLAEIFGPTIQGEGFLVGKSTYFVRVGGCDYKCLWCDTAHAVLPTEVRKLERKPVSEIILDLAEWRRGHPGATWLAISGGNPAMYDLHDLVRFWQTSGEYDGEYKITVETQGSRWAPWLREVDVLTVSPKPPSSGLSEEASLTNLRNFMEAHFGGLGYVEGRYVAIKCIVFDESDYQFAKEVHKIYDGFGFFLSTGTAMGGLSGKWVPPEFNGPDYFAPIREQPDHDWSKSGALVEPQWNLLLRYRWLAERMMNDPEMSDVAVGVQQHALLWGITTKGV